MSFELDRATALHVLGPGRFAGAITRDYWIHSGPNGGYMAAIALRGATALVDEPDRVVRSLHLRYLSAPRDEPFELHASILRRGRSMTSVSVSLQQAGREFLSASACFSSAFSSLSFQDEVLPEARPFAESIPLAKVIPMNHRFDTRLAIGALTRTGARALTGGYIRFVDQRPLDALGLAVLWDAWPPAVYFRALDPAPDGPMPTVEASVYFRKQVALPGDAYALLRTRSVMAHEGLVEEDAELWSPDGQLLVQSRQLALCL